MECRKYIIGIAMANFFCTVRAQNPGNSSKPLQATGILTLSSSVYSSDLQTQNDALRTPSSPPFLYTLQGNFTLFNKTGNFYMPASFIIGEQQRSYRQPFNQFSLNPTYKSWLKGYVGYTNLSFSQFTLGGATFLGAAIDLSPKLFRFGASYGRFNKAIPVRADDAINNVTPTYERLGYSVKLGVGSDRNHADLIYFHAKDIISSLPADSIDSTLRPEENLCIGITSHQQFGKVASGKYVVWDLDFAGSLLTRDIRLDSVNLGSNSKEQRLYDFANRFVKVNFSTTPTLAGQTSLYFQDKHFNIKIGYRRIDPNYSTLGAYFFANDLERVYLQPKFSALKNKIIFSANAYYQHNNLANSLDSDHLITRPSTTRTFRDDNTINVQLPASGRKSAGFNFQNGIFSNKGESVKKDTGVYNLNNLNLNFSITPYLTLVKNKVVHSFTVLINYTDNIDRNPITSSSDQGHSVLLNLAYSAFFISNKLNLSIAANDYLSHLGSNKISYIGGSLGVSESFLQSRLTANASVNFNPQSGKADSTITKSSALIINAGGTYQPGSHHRLTLNISYLKNDTNSGTAQSFYELKIDVVYAFRF